MNEFQKIHTLSQELILIYEELERDAQQIVTEHMEQCEACKRLFENREDEAVGFTPLPVNKEEAIKPFKKLLHFKWSLNLMLIAIRVVFLVLIVYTSIMFYDWDLSAKAAVDYVQYTVFLFYFPGVLFLNIFTFVFFHKRWVWLFVLFDLVIILYLDTMMTAFV